MYGHNDIITIIIVLLAVALPLCCCFCCERNKTKIQWIQQQQQISLYDKTIYANTLNVNKYLQYLQGERKYILNTSFFQY